MGTAWWLALGAVVALALVAALVDGRARLGPLRPARRAPEAHRPEPGPVPGEIWWALVPHGDGSGGENRPCLVLAVGRESVRVADITIRRDGPGRAASLLLPPGAVDGAPGHRSYLETDEARQIPPRAFRHRAGEVSPELWEQVRHLAG